jgi:tRNA modification GTPase
MSAPHSLVDTIAAIATAEGPAGLAVVRISGPEAWLVAGRVARVDGAPLSGRAAGTFVRAAFVDPGSNSAIDDGVVLLFRAPASYTGEDVVELQGHGGPVLPRAVLRAVLGAGARMAGPGEFTRRAFLNGRIDLAQAEAVMDLVRAQSDRAAQAARAQLAGGVSREVDACCEELLTVRADVAAQLDFEEGALSGEIRDDARARVARLGEAVGRLLATQREGQLLRQGALVVIGGCPNAGKSSLLNALLKSDRAIVSTYPGTTRDVLEESVVLQGIPLRVMDTAGLREAEHPVEQEGVARAHRALQAADLVIYVVDASRPLSGQHPHLLAQALGQAGAPLLVALNKNDLPQCVTDDEVRQALRSAGVAATEPFLSLCARNGDGLAALQQAIVARLGVDLHAPAHAAVSERHAAELVQAREALTRARECLAQGDARLVLAAGELDAAAAALGRITGRVRTDELLDAVFSRFCVGK